MVEGKEYLVLSLSEVILEGEAGIIFVVVVTTQKVDVSVRDPFPAFEPPRSFSFVFFSGEDGDGHALSEEGSLFGQIGQSEPSQPCSSVAAPEEEPIVVAVCVDIVLEQEIVLSLLDTLICTANVPALEIGIDPIRSNPI